VIAPAALPLLAASAPFTALVTDEAAGSAVAGGAAEVMMNPFGVAFVAITWAMLVGLNLWCLRKLLKHRDPA